jgi:hypothetical protein
MSKLLSLFINSPEVKPWKDLLINPQHVGLDGEDVIVLVKEGRMARIVRPGEISKHNGSGLMLYGPDSFLWVEDSNYFLDMHGPENEIRSVLFFLYYEKVNSDFTEDPGDRLVLNLLRCVDPDCCPTFNLSQWAETLEQSLPCDV